MAKTTYMEQYRVAGRNDMPGLLLSAWAAGEIDDAECAEKLPHAYNAAEWPCRYINPDLWVQVLTKLGWVGDQERPSEPVQLYRAQVGPVPGLSWTAARYQAEWFHQRNLGFGLESEGARLLSETIDPDGILGVFTGREGVEYLVDPDWTEEFADSDWRGWLE